MGTDTWIGGNILGSIIADDHLGEVYALGGHIGVDRSTRMAAAGDVVLVRAVQVQYVDAAGVTQTATGDIRATIESLAGSVHGVYAIGGDMTGHVRALKDVHQVVAGWDIHGWRWRNGVRYRGKVGVIPGNVTGDVTAMQGFVHNVSARGGDVTGHVCAWLGDIHYVTAAGYYDEGTATWIGGNITGRIESGLDLYEVTAVDGTISAHVHAAGDLYLLQAIHGSITGEIGSTGITHVIRAIRSGDGRGGNISAHIDIGRHLYHLYADGDITGNIDVYDDLGRPFQVRQHGRLTWVSEGLWCGGNLTGVTNVFRDAWRIEVIGQLRGPLTVHRDAKSIYLGRGASTTGDIAVTGHLTHLRSRGDTHAGDLRAGSITEAFYENTNGLDAPIVVTRNDTDGDLVADTTGNVDLLHITNGTTANGSISIAGNLGVWRRVRRAGRWRWEPVAFWTNGDVNGSITVGGDVLDLSVQGHTSGSINIGGDLGAWLEIRRWDRRWWVPLGFWTGGDMNADFTVGGDMLRFAVDGRANGAIDIGGDAGSFVVGGQIDGTIDVGGDFGTWYPIWIHGWMRMVPLGFRARGDMNADITVDGQALALVVEGHTNGAIHIGGDLGAWHRVWREGRRTWESLGFWTEGDLNADVTIGGHVVQVVVEGETNGDLRIGSIESATLGNGLTATSEIEVTGDVESLRIAGDVAGAIDVGGHLGVAEIGYSTPYRQGGRTRWSFHDATFTGTLQAGSMGGGYCHATTGLQGAVTVTGDADALHVTNGQMEAAVTVNGNLGELAAVHGTSAGGTITVGGDLGVWRRVRTGGRWTWVPFGLYSGGDVNADISVGGTALLIDIRGDLVGASINRALSPTAELVNVVVGGEIRSTDAQWIRASSGTFHVSDSTRSADVAAGFPYPFGNVTAQVG